MLSGNQKSHVANEVLNSICANGIFFSEFDKVLLLASKPFHLEAITLKCFWVNLDIFSPLELAFTLRTPISKNRSEFCLSCARFDFYAVY